MSRFARIAALAVTVTLLPFGSASAAAPCSPVDAPLTGSPLPTNTGLPQAYRTDTDGFTTVTGLIDDPADGNPVVSFETTTLLPPLPAGTKAGTWYHQWEHAPQIVTIGIWTSSDAGKVRLPLVAIEGLGGSIDSVSLNAQARVLNDVTHHLFTTAPYLWNYALTGGQHLDRVPVAGPVVGALGFGIATYFYTAYPGNFGWESHPPVYIWESYKNAAGAQIWGGQALRRSGSYEYASTAGSSGGHGCTRTRIDAVIRTADTAVTPAGVWITEEAEGHCEGSCTNPSQDAQFDARQRITSGVRVQDIDIPLIVLNQEGHKRGTQPFLLYPDYQRETISLGVSVAGTYVPLIGTRAETWHAAPPERQNRLLSVGAYDPLGNYRPIIGTRMHFERHVSDSWFLMLALDGFGSQDLGDAMIDIGTFDHNGQFVPVLGTRYDDDFPGNRYEHRGMISTGPYVGDTWVPAVAVTYDGEQPLTQWALANSNDRSSEMGAWIVAAGAWNPNPLVGYRPVVGVRYLPGAGTPTEPIHETYRVGTFPIAYETFIPLAGADYFGSQTSASFAARYAGAPTADARRLSIASSSRVAVGAETPATGFVPIVGARMTPGSPQRVDAGVWTPLGYLPLVTVCQGPSTSPSDGSVGLGLGGTGGPVDSSLVRLGWQVGGTPSASPSAC